MFILTRRCPHIGLLFDYRPNHFVAGRINELIEMCRVSFVKAGTNTCPTRRIRYPKPASFSVPTPNVRGDVLKALISSSSSDERLGCMKQDRANRVDLLLAIPLVTKTAIGRSSFPPKAEPIPLWLPFPRNLVVHTQGRARVSATTDQTNSAGRDEKFGHCNPNPSQSSSRRQGCRCCHINQVCIEDYCGTAHHQRHFWKIVSASDGRPVPMAIEPR